MTESQFTQAYAMLVRQHRYVFLTTSPCTNDDAIMREVDLSSIILAAVQITHLFLQHFGEQTQFDFSKRLIEKFTNEHAANAEERESMIALVHHRLQDYYILDSVQCKFCTCVIA